MTKTTPDSRKSMGSRTRMVHAGRHPWEQHGFVNTPVYRGSTVLSPTVADLSGRKARFVYGTRGTPTTEALEHAWSELSGAADTVLAPSGLAAIALAFMAVVKSGDHILVRTRSTGPAAFSATASGWVSRRSITIRTSAPGYPR